MEKELEDTSKDLTIENAEDEEADDEEEEDGETSPVDQPSEEDDDDNGIELIEHKLTELLKPLPIHAFKSRTSEHSPPAVSREPSPTPSQIRLMYNQLVLDDQSRVSQQDYMTQDGWKIHKNIKYILEDNSDPDNDDGISATNFIKGGVLKQDKSEGHNFGDDDNVDDDDDVIVEYYDHDDTLFVDDGYDYDEGEHEPTSPRVVTSENFFQNVMTISETPAIERLSQEALGTNVVDPVLEILDKYRDIDDEFACTEGELYESSTKPVLQRCPSVESFFRQHDLVDVHIYLFPGKKMLSKEIRMDANVYQLKLAIGRYCKVGPERLDLRRRFNLIPDTRTLKELGAKPGKKMRFTVQINRRIPGPAELKIKDTSDVDYPKKPDTVRVVSFNMSPDMEGRVETYQRTVRIVHQDSPKPMVGGYLDKRTNRIFHDATNSPMEAIEDIKKSIKEAKFLGIVRTTVACQTFNEEDLGTQTLIDKATQMERRDYYVSSVGDYFIKSKRYKSAEEVEAIRTHAIITIQRYCRKWLAVRELEFRREGLIARVAWAERIRKGRLDQKRKIMNDELQRQQNPKRLVDLELLYRAINSWRMEQEEYIKANRWGAERKAALAHLTEMESDLLLELERTKRKIIMNQKDEHSNQEFRKMGEVKRWFGSKSSSFFISYDTEGRQHCRNLHEVYKSLLKAVPNTPEATEDRIQLINKVHKMIIMDKRTQQGDHPMADMLVELITRELKFMGSKASPSVLKGIRRRVANTFFRLCKDPGFNEEAARIGKIPTDPTKLQKDMVPCKGCKRMQYRDEFTIIKGTTVASRCRSCMGLYRTAILRIDLNLYRQILNELRRDEFKAGIMNSMAFLIDAMDMQFLVEKIWHGQSALSGIDNRYLLRLCRWIKDKPWSPWNCVLLTEEEAVAHVQLDDIQQAYQESFFHKVSVKHSTAKTYFEGLAKFAVGLDDRFVDGCKRIGRKNKGKKGKERNNTSVMSLL